MRAKTYIRVKSFYAVPDACKLFEIPQGIVVPHLYVVLCLLAREAQNGAETVAGLNVVNRTVFAGRAAENTAAENSDGNNLIAPFVKQHIDGTRVVRAAVYVFFGIR